MKENTIFHHGKRYFPKWETHFQVTSAIMQQQHYKKDSNHHFLIKKSFYFEKIMSIYRLFEANLYRLWADFSLFRPFTATSHVTTTASETLCTKAFQKTCGSVAANFENKKFSNRICHL